MTDSPTDTTDSLSVTEAAARLGVSERTIWRRIKQGKLDTHKTTDGLRVSLSDISPKATDTGPVSDSKATDRPTDSVSVAPAAEVLELVRLVDRLQRDNQQLAGQLGFTTAKLQEAEKTIALLMAPKDEPAEVEPRAAPEPGRSWWQRLRGR